MKKISKKIIPIKYSNYLSEKLNLNFYLASTNTFNDLNRELNILVYKKGLYRYILPGKFKFPIKYYFKKHTIINFELSKEIIPALINNKISWEFN